MNSDAHFENEREEKKRGRKKVSGGGCDGSRNRYQPGCQTAKGRKRRTTKRREKEKEQRNPGKVRGNGRHVKSSGKRQPQQEQERSKTIAE